MRNVKDITYGPDSPIVQLKIMYFCPMKTKFFGLEYVAKTLTLPLCSTPVPITFDHVDRSW